MASIVLGNAGTAIGGALGGPVGAAIGGLVGTVAGSFVDNALFSPKLPNIQGPRLSDLSVQTSTYGRMIPIVYGNVRIAGNVIWSQPIKEVANSTSTGGGKGGAGAKQTTTTFSYFATLAIALCEGEIDDVIRVWADSKLIDPSEFSGSYKLYKGDETQLPDPTIESFEGLGNVPAYRGMAYVVIEDFPLADFGNRIPNFTFEVKRRLLIAETGDKPVEEMISGLVMIPATGEFAYDTDIQYKVVGEQVGSDFVQSGSGRTRINQNNLHNKADALVALDQALATCPNLEWISIAIAWFGDSPDAGSCVIKPGVEYQTGATTEPDSWQVAGFIRATARQITLDAGGAPVYGGTPDDDSLLRYLDELKSRGLKVLFYPLVLMDVNNKPWRGSITGSTTDVANFFTKTDGYNTFINHYANLVKDKIDAFSIGSELIGLTSVKDAGNNFPAVDELVSLAATVKTTVGSSVKVTYSADWSEYHHTDGGWYNLDPLWASANIDFVGIDAYFPLTDEPQSGLGYDLQKVIDGWTSGEGYDWVYTDSSRTTKDFTLEDRFAWKNIDFWWKNTHVNPDSTTTAWVPESKKIWFTEYGFPSVDGATNQPNVFYDPDSVSGGFPYHSRGRVDFRAQRLGLTATEKQWEASGMIERMFAWTWDARPYPFWPDLDAIWKDGDLWETGHWVQGKLGLSGLGAIVREISQRAGLLLADIDVTALTELVDGYILTEQTTARSAIEGLQQAFFFDAVESDNLLKFVPRGGVSAAAIADSNLIPDENGDNRDLLKITRQQEVELPQKVDIGYINRSFDYQIGNQHSQRQTANSDELLTVNLPIVMPNQRAKDIADITLFNSWLGRTTYNFQLPLEYAELEPSDIVDITVESAIHNIRITAIDMGKPGLTRLSGIAEDVSIYDTNGIAGDSGSQTGTVSRPADTRMEILDLPAFPTDLPEQGSLRFALSGLEENWPGAAVFRSDDDGISYQQVTATDDAAVIGSAVDALSVGTTDIFDNENKVTVILLGGELESVSELAVLNGANAALLGNEIIQFKNAVLVAENKYELSGLLRGRLGTEHETGNHITSERFVKLDNRLSRVVMANSLIGLSRKYKGVTINQLLSNAVEQDFTYNANGLKPLSPVHIEGTRDGSNNLTINWIRRTRIGGEWRDFVDVPLGEASEKYEVDIMNSAGTAVLHTISGITTPQTTYTAADQTSDFGSPQPSITIRIYQLSEIIGRGHKAGAVV